MMEENNSGDLVDSVADEVQDSNELDHDEGPPISSTNTQRTFSPDDDHDGRLYKRMVSRRCTRTAFEKCPGACAFLIGVVIPLFLLIVMALFFGTFLARLEAPEEVEANDEVLKNKYLANRAQSSLNRLSTYLPHTCLGAFAQGLPTEPFGDILELVVKDPLEFLNESLSSLEEIKTNESITMTDFFTYMIDCGQNSQEFLDERFADAADDNGELTFNWIRCYPGAEGLKIDLRSDVFEWNEVNPSVQRDYYTQSWEQSYNISYTGYLIENIGAGMGLVEAHFDASDRSLESATGGDYCNLNGSGSAWFWFTVETTVGYGNQAPTSAGGRALVFTAGFVSILAFASVLATSGSVVAVLFDEYVCHGHPALKRFAKAGWGAIFWGSLWLAWMLLIAKVTRRWKNRRLDEDMRLGEGYWFAYISTTTVGLGDFFLEPEVVTGMDLLTYPLLFLVGFTLLSAFLGKFAEFFMDLAVGGNRTLVESLIARIQSRRHHDENEKEKRDRAEQPLAVDTPKTAANDILET